MASALVDAFELLILAEQLGPRLDAAAAALAQLPDLADEKAWLATACARIAIARRELDAHPTLVERSLRLADLADMKAERGKLMQAAIAEGIEHLQASIAFAAGERSPLIDTLFMDLKVPALRKCSRAELEKFVAELERRLGSAYARRLLASERYAPVVPAVAKFRAAFRVWASVFVEPPLEGEAADVLREELLATSRAIDLPLRQARLLAQAALLPAVDVLDAAGVVTLLATSSKAKRDNHPILDRDPPDPLLPTADERAEIAELHGAS